MKKFFSLCTFLLVITLLSSCSLQAEESLATPTPTQQAQISEFVEKHTADMCKLEETETFSVYISPTGKKYHYRSTCAGKNAIPVTLKDAKKYYTPCKKCT